MPVKEEMKKVKVHQATVEKTDWTQVKIGVEDWPHLLEKDGTFLKLVKKCQEEVYAADLRRLQKKKSVRGDSSLVSLAPILDEDGLLRLGGRSGKAKLPYEVLHPPIIPGSHPLASTIAKACHEKFTHAGTDFVLAQLRQVVWVTRGRSVVKKIRLSCLQCMKERSKPGIQLMADLPACRLDYESPAFTQTSVDCFGPFECETSRNRTKKVWGCLFTCLVTRALYVTTVESISTEDFLLALRQLVAIYGRPKRLWLDNGTNFVGAERELREEAQRIYESQGFQEYLKRKGMDFTFQPPRTPHWGGSHESQVKCVKKSLYRAMGAESNKLRHPTINMLRTIFYEIAGLLNTRPLTYVSSDPLDFRPITPADFLARPAVTDFPAEEGLDADPRQKYAYVQKCVNLAWSFWKSAFLQDLASRRKWRNVERNFAVGDFVMEVDDQLKRGEWRTGRIVAVYPSSDGLVRAVDFQTETGTYRRGIVRLALLEPAKSSAGSPSSSTASGEHGSADTQDSAKSP